MAYRVRISNLAENDIDDIVRHLCQVQMITQHPKDKNLYYKSNP